MTRKKALSTAISLLSEINADHQVINILKELQNEMPIYHWVRSSIIDAIETYAEEHNNTLPPISQLTNKNNLPSKTVIRAFFNVETINDFYKIYFPHLNCQNKSSSPYRFKCKTYFLDIFKLNYKRIQQETQLKIINTKIYEKYKDSQSPHISTIIKNSGCNSYNDLLIQCGYKKEKQELISVTNVSYNDNMDSIELEEIIKNFSREKYRNEIANNQNRKQNSDM